MNRISLILGNKIRPVNLFGYDFRPKEQMSSSLNQLIMSINRPQAQEFEDSGDPKEETVTLNYSYDEMVFHGATQAHLWGAMILVLGI